MPGEEKQLRGYVVLYDVYMKFEANYPPCDMPLRDLEVEQYH